MCYPFKFYSSFHLCTPLRKQLFGISSPANLVYLSRTGPIYVVSIAASDGEHCLGIYVVPLVPGLHAVFKSVSSQADARRLSHADQVCQVWPVVQYSYVTLKTQTILRLHNTISRRGWCPSPTPASPCFASQ